MINSILKLLGLGKKEEKAIVESNSVLILKNIVEKPIQPAETPQTTKARGRPKKSAK